jgi:hypothetical protein
MRLFELLENVPVDVTTKPQHRPYYFGTDRVGSRGEGAFGIVYQDINNPHEVMKFSTGTQAYRDGYLDYIQEIANDESIQDNPWVPRILKIRIHNDEDGEVVDFTVRLEALETFDSVGVDELIAIAERVFTEKYVEYMKVKNQRWDPRHYAASIYRAVVYKIWHCIKYEELEDIQDEHFIEFINWHSKVYRKHSTHHSFDASPGNMMVRRSPYGFQPVITDPWA